MAQVDVQQAQQGFGWIGFVVVAILTLLGGGTLITVLVKAGVERYWGKKDKREDIHETNQTARINADASLAEKTMERLNAVEDRLNTKITALEAKVEDLQGQLSDQREMNATKDVKIAHLETENAELKAEVKQLREDRRTSDKTIATLRGELDALKLIVAQNQASGGD